MHSFWLCIRVIGVNLLSGKLDLDFVSLNSIHFDNFIHLDNQVMENSAFHHRSQRPWNGQRNGFASRVRPNFFVAIQIRSFQIHNSVKQIQEHLLHHDRRLESSLIERETLHLTLMVMCLNGSMDQSKAMHALEDLHEEINEDLCRDPVKLKFDGLGNFGDHVLFAKIKEDRSYYRLRNLSRDVHQKFAEYGIYSTDTRNSFSPHLTIAKLSKDPSMVNQKIPPSTYESFLHKYMGSDVITSIQLLKMSGPKTDTGYYVGYELFFCLNGNEETETQK